MTERMTRLTRRSDHTAWRRCGTEASDDDDDDDDDDDGDIDNDECHVVRREAAARAQRRVQQRASGV